MTFQQKSLKMVKQANYNIKMATAKGVRTPWMVIKSISSNASEPYNSRKNDSLFRNIVHHYQV
jgi:hypothetical protein